MKFADITTVDWSAAIKHRASEEVTEQLRRFLDAAVAAKFENKLWREAEGQADMNVAWYEGRQDFFVDDGGTYMSIYVPYADDEVRLVYNDIEPNVNATVAIYGQQILDWQVMPATDDSGDQDQAELNTQVIQYYWDYLDMPSVMQANDQWAVSTGMGAIKVCWNPDKGPEMNLTPDDVGLTDAEFKRQYEGIREIFLGDVDAYSVPIFNLFWEPYDLPSPRGCEYCIEVYDRTRAHVLSKYPDLDPEDIGAGSREDQLWRPRSDFGRDTSEMQRVIRVVELWVPPQFPVAPNGAHVIMVGKHIVLRSEFPYDHGRVPIFVFTPRPRLGKPIGSSPIESAIFPQHDLNGIMSQRSNNRQIMSNPYILAEENAIVDEEEWDSRPGGIRRFRTGSTPPSIEQGAGMPGIVVADEQAARNQIMQAFGLRDASQGRNPAGVRSARQIVALQEADETQFGPIRERREHFAAEVARAILQTAAQYVREPRMARILGDEDDFRVVEFSGDLLTGQQRTPEIDYFDVRVKNSGVARTRAQTEALILQLIQYQGINMADPDMRSSVFETLQFGDPIKRLDATSRDKSIQRRRNRMMMQGVYEPPNTWENHGVLMSELNAFRKGGAYRQSQHQELFQQYEIDLYAAQLLKESVVVAGARKALSINPQLKLAGAAPDGPA